MGSIYLFCETLFWVLVLEVTVYIGLLCTSDLQFDRLFCV